MKKGFTIVEVSILFVIFLIVAFLVAPLSLDDTMQAKNTSQWRRVQEDFANIFNSINTEKNTDNAEFSSVINNIISSDIKSEIKPYRISFMNKSFSDDNYKFNEYKTTYSNATIAVRIFDDNATDKRGLLMYDVNGSVGPNIWGKDVFGLNLYNDHFEPFCKNEPLSKQKRDCSRQGSGLCCSNYYLIGGNFD